MTQMKLVHLYKNLYMIDPQACASDLHLKQIKINYKITHITLHFMTNTSLKINCKIYVKRIMGKIR